MKGVIVDLGINNIQSLQHKIARLGINVEVGETATAIDDSDFIFLPGIGHFNEAMNRIRDRGLVDILETKVLKNKTPRFWLDFLKASKVVHIQLEKCSQTTLPNSS